MARKRTSRNASHGGSRDASKGKRGGPARGLPDRQPSRLVTEQLSRAIGKILSQHEFENDEQVNAFIQENIVGRPLEDLMGEYEPTPEEEAQELAYRAMDAETPEEALLLAGEALELDPDNIDALMMFAPLFAETDEALAAYVEMLVKNAEKKMGAGYMKEHEGHFWGVTETRPYMRARAKLVDLLRRTGRFADAIAHAEAMLELNPNDNQGIRDSLLGLYLRVGDLEGARRLFEQYGDAFAVFGWGRVLERFLAGDSSGAKAAFVKAQKDNIHVRDYLTGRKNPPKHGPDFYSPGDPSEAYVCVSEIGDAWRAYPEAIAWLKSL